MFILQIKTPSADKWQCLRKFYACLLERSGIATLLYYRSSTLTRPSVRNCYFSFRLFGYDFELYITNEFWVEQILPILLCV